MMTDMPVLEPLMHQQMVGYYLSNAAHFGNQCREALEARLPVEEVVSKARLAASYGLDAMNWRPGLDV